MPKKSSLLETVSVVGSVSQTGDAAAIGRLAAASDADLVELRLDCYPDAAMALQNAAAAGTLPPLLVTARSPEEGGRHSLTIEARSALLSAFHPHAAVLDVEMGSLAQMRELIQQIRQSPALLLASFHDFTGTPDLEMLREKMHTAVEAGADAVKFATTLTGPEDAATLARLFALPNRPPLSVMGMGPLGKVSRLLFAKLGSIFNYGYLDAATVPGQWEAGQLKRRLAEL